MEFRVLKECHCGRDRQCLHSHSVSSPIGDRQQRRPAKPNHDDDRQSKQDYPGRHLNENAVGTLWLVLNMGERG